MKIVPTAFPGVHCAILYNAPTLPLILTENNTSERSFLGLSRPVRPRNRLANNLARLTPRDAMAEAHRLVFLIHAVSTFAPESLANPGTYH